MEGFDRIVDERDCATSFDVWAHMSWIMLNLSRHLATVADLANWLEGTYLFCGASRLNFLPGFPKRASSYSCRQQNAFAGEA
jgi:hypothetical protein